MRALLSCSLAALFGFNGAALASPPPSVPVDDQYHAVTSLRDLNSLGIALEGYARDHGGYPKVGSTAELEKLLEPNYAMQIETKDAWGTELRYELSADAKSYRLVSAGSDRTFDESSWGTPIVSTDSKTDAVFSAHFVRKWSIVFP